VSPGPSETVPRLIEDALNIYQDDPIAVSILESHARRLGEPLRIAVAGMVKAGKSTLINAMLGEEIAPTDAGECTRTVVWYRYGDKPRVTVHPIIGKPRTVHVEEVAGRRSFTLTGIRAEDVERVVVEWPSDSLRDLILIDTPGIASLSGEISKRSTRFLIPEGGSSEADAIIYVLRHLHQADLTFLKAYRDTAGAQSGAVNALAVLSRADEIGAGRLESLLAARDIAKRYRSDEALRSLAIGVLPVAGRLAQTARTLQQSELDALVQLTKLDRKAREGLLISADRFVKAQARAAGSQEDRAALIDRFGLFGIRLATVLIQNGFSELEPLARELARRSGLDELLGLIATQFRVRDEQLKARAAIVGVETLLRQRPHAGTRALASAVERIEAESHEFRELRLLATANTSGIALAPELTAEMLRLVGSEGVSPAERLGLPPDAPRTEVRSRAMDHVARWRARAEDPLTDRATAELCRIVVRSCEGILAQTHNESGARSPTLLLLGTEPGAGARKEA
jgi:hypothetical protein